MSALLYLRRTRLKNQLKGLLKKPLRLLWVVFFVACILLSGLGTRSSFGDTYRDSRELAAIAEALYLLIFIMTVDGGFSRGGNLFTMPDVNLLFPAPLSPRRVLFHGLLQQMAASLYIGIFMLFQYGNLKIYYGVTFLQLLLLLVCFGLAAFLGQITAMLIYSYTNGNSRRQKLARVLLYGATAAFLIWLVLPAAIEGTALMLPKMVGAANSGVSFCFPVAGWLGMAANGILTENPVYILMGFLSCAAYFFLLLMMISRSDADYYEDVLKSAEMTQSAITAQKEGTLRDAVPQNVRVGRTGFRRGWGASAFFYKHRLENRRSSKFLLGTRSLIFAAVVIGFAIVSKSGGLIPVFAMSVYLQIFSSLTGRFNLELTKPYLYLLPEPPFAKLLWALTETIPSALAEGTVIFVPVGLILSLPPAEVLLCILARLTYSVIFLAAEVVLERLWGGVASRGLTMLLFMALAIGLSLPGIAAGIFIAAAGGLHFSNSLAVAALVNLACSGVALFLCRNMLQYAELNNQ